MKPSRSCTHLFTTCALKGKTCFARRSHLQPSPDVGTEGIGNIHRPSLHLCVARPAKILLLPLGVCGASVIRRVARGSRVPSRLRNGVVWDAGRVENLQEETSPDGPPKYPPTPAEVAPFFFHPINTPALPHSSHWGFARRALLEFPILRRRIRTGGIGLVFRGFTWSETTAGRSMV